MKRHPGNADVPVGTLSPPSHPGDTTAENPVAKTKPTGTSALPALTPKLRFPEFRGASPWKQTELGKESSIIKGKGISKSDIHPDGTIPCIRYGELYTHYKEIIRSVISKTISPANELLISKSNDVIIPSSGETKIDIATASCVLLDGIALGGDLNVIRSNLNGSFLSYYINGPKRLDIAKVAQGHTVVHLYPYQLEALEIAIPSSAEQQKIAECLSTLDELIGAENRKLDALKAHKKGLMQQLFPRPGESTPRLRFPEFQDAPEWEETQLGQLAYYENGKAYEQDIVENGKYVVVNSRFISTDGVVRKYTNADYLIAKTGEVLMVLSDLPKGKALAKCYFVETGNRYAVNQRICRLKPKEINGKFLYYVLNRHPRLLAFDDGLNQTHLSKGGVTECQLCVPQDKDEQHRIADCLTSLDSQIAAQTTRLATLRTHKQGLMQQLFPSACTEEGV